MKNAIDSVQAGEPRSQLFRIAATLLGLTLVQMICRFGWRMTLVRTSMLSGRDLRDRFATKLFSLSASFFDRMRTGDLMSLATSDVEAVRMSIGAGFILFVDALFFLLTIPFVMAWLSPGLTVLAFITLPLVPIVVIVMERKIHARFQKVQECASQLSSLAQENLMGIRLVKAHAREDAQIRIFREKGEEFARLNQHLARVQTTLGPSLDFLMSLGLVLLLAYGGRKVLGAEVSLGTFVAFQRYIQRLVWPMAALGMAVTYYQRGVTSEERIRKVLEEETGTPEAENPVLPEGAPKEGEKQNLSGSWPGPWRTKGRIELRDLRFRFPGSGKEILHGITLSIEPGERLGIAGRVGSGKSVLLGLLPRLYSVGKGMIFLDGVDVNDWPLEKLRDQVGYVGQDLFLFSDTILENVGLGLPGEFLQETGLDASSVNPVEAFARTASIHEEIARFPERYLTKLGERGNTLSGGQRQRLALARALAREPAVLILDDALSAVDSETEETVLSRLRARAPRATELVASQRISAIEEADRVIVLEGGRIAQVGTHRSLLKERAGPYRLLYEEQELEKEAIAYEESLRKE